MTRWSYRVAYATCALFVFTACQSRPPDSANRSTQGTPLHSDRGGIGVRKQEATSGPINDNPVNPRRSLVVTEKAILDKFSLKDVLDQLVAQNGGTGFTSTQLFRQLWDTQNPAPGQPDLPGMPHCTDNGNTLNGFPYPCREFEGQQASPSSPITMASYSAVGLYNRFDLAPGDGADCGEYRIVFAKTDNNSDGRNFIIFEFILSNPNPQDGLDACEPVQFFWRELTREESVAVRGDKLRDFYFEGLNTGSVTFPPVVHMNHLGNNARKAGQVRVNMFIFRVWLLREFNLVQSCPASGCTLKYEPVTVKTNPFGSLLNPASTHPLAAEFQDHFVTQVASLAKDDINRFNYDVPDKFNVGQSDSQTPGAVDDYVLQFGPGPSAFHTRIKNELTAINSKLTPQDIVARAQALSCGGCHQRSNNQSLGDGMVWPPSANFVHNTENLESSTEGDRYIISPALNTVFLPHRKEVMESYLDRMHALATGRSALTGVTATRGDAYWLENTSPGTIMKKPLGASPAAFVTGRAALAGVATDGQNLYWLENTNPGSVMKVALTGGAPTALVTGRFALTGIATDGTHVYWTENTLPGNILSVPVGGGAPALVQGGRPNLGAIAVDSTNLYWVESGTTIMQLAKVGGLPVAAVSNRTNITGVATDGKVLFWSENNNPGTLLKMNLPVGVISARLPNDRFGLTGLAVDSDNLYWLEDTNPGVVMTAGK